MGFSRLEYWSGYEDPLDLHTHSSILAWSGYEDPGDLPDPGIEPGSPALQVDSLPTEL